MPPEDDLLDLHEVAQLMRCSSRTVLRIKDDQDGLPHIRLRGRLLFRRSSVLAWIEAQERQSCPRRVGRRASKMEVA